MGISQTITAHAQEVWGKSDKKLGSCQLEIKAAELIPSSELSLALLRALTGFEHFLNVFSFRK